ncbi:MAG TPA: YbaK/EbsC family protein [Candidatus Babeliales bacterium]|nr:YbaK/EbsC family protein [Candidatus Babeliales bacterium]HLC06802.1 YbaK/EbsC family protein [Candidatus Babeliales bacterium]
MSSEILVNKSVEKVQAALTHFGIATKITQFPEGTRTAQEAAAAIGCSVAQIVKSIIFCTEKNNSPILVLTSGINRVDEKMIEQALGEKIKKASADFVKEVTGFAIGGVPPVGHAQKITTFIDKDLLHYQEVWAAAGTPYTVFCLISSDLSRITDGAVVKVT